MNTFKKLLEACEKDIEQEYQNMKLSEEEIQYRKMCRHLMHQEFEKIIIEG